jgi:hypothetical protein
MLTGTYFCIAAALDGWFTVMTFAWTEILNMAIVGCTSMVANISKTPGEPGEFASFCCHSIINYAKKSK